MQKRAIANLTQQNITVAQLYTVKVEGGAGADVITVKGYPHGAGIDLAAFVIA